MRSEIMKWGNSQGIRLPKHLLERAGLGAHDEVELMVENHSIIIRKSAPRHKTIQERFADFDGVYEPIQVDWGEARGREVW